MDFDVAIIGGGPAGYTAAERAGANGLRAVMFEKEFVGGVCLNIGCIPTKTLLYSAKLLDNIKGAAKYGISASEPGFNLEKMMERKQKTVKRLTDGVRMTVLSGGAVIVEKEAVIDGEEGGRIRILCDGKNYLVRYLLICTGSDAVIPPIPGLSEVEYWTSTEALEARELPKSLVIIGGGVIGMEFASFFHSMGVRVHVVEMMPEILGTMDKETSAMLRSAYTKKGVNFYLKAKVISATQQGVTIERDGRTHTIEADKILVSVGRRATLSGVGLEKLSIELERNGIKVNQYMQTSHPQVYACGDVTGYSLLAHTAIRESEVAIDHILGEEDPMCYDCIPAVVYTNPELASVGRTEEELKQAGIRYRVMKLPMLYSGRFMAENELVNGLCKLVVDGQDRVIGCQMFGNPASELIVIAGIAIQHGYTVAEFQKSVFPHPTVSEIYHEVLFS